MFWSRVADLSNLSRLFFRVPFDFCVFSQIFLTEKINPTFCQKHLILAWRVLYSYWNILVFEYLIFLGRLFLDKPNTSFKHVKRSWLWLYKRLPFYPLVILCIPHQTPQNCQVRQKLLIFYVRVGSNLDIQGIQIVSNIIWKQLYYKAANSLNNPVVITMQFPINISRTSVLF